MATKVSGEKKSWLGTRLFSIAALCCTVGGLGFAARETYRVATDSFVAPIVLSPDSDLVIQSKLSMSALVAERMRLEAKRDEIDAEREAGELAIKELKSLQAGGAKALEWTSAVSARVASGGARDLRALARQKTVISSMISGEETYLESMKKDVSLGLVAKSEYARELHSLDQMRVAEIENERANIMTGVQVGQAVATQQALKSANPAGIATPEMLMQQELLVRVQCDLLKLEAEQRARKASLCHIEDELAKLDELVAQLKSRPIFRATEASTNVAFVPYTQMEGVKSGARIYECFWGVVACKPVGKVAELLPGEVLVPDPWGTPARGQYALIDLSDQHAAQSRTLRIRPSSGPAPSLQASLQTELKRVALK